MKDIATYGGWKLWLEGLGFSLLGLLMLGVVALVPCFIIADHAHPAVSVIALFPLLMGWTTLARGARALRRVFEKGCFLRAGPEGLALRLPGEARRSSLYFAYDMWEYSFRWEEVESVSWSLDWQWRNLVIRARGGRLELEGTCFGESVPAILDNLRRAAQPVSPPIQKTTL